MKTIGLIGGLSWQSTLTYYRLLNEAVGERLGGHHSADLRIWSGDFEPIHQAQLKDDHDWIGSVLADAGKGLAAAGADLLVIASNTCHRYAGQVESSAGIPVVHIIDATAERIAASDLTRVLLLGTDYTMSGEFYTGYMDRFGIECVVPEPDERTEVHRIIFDELVHGDIRKDSKRELLEIIERSASRGAEGVILGCTELGLILDEGDGAVPGFDTTTIHCAAVVDAALRT
ncbi:MAG: amino acid racemase [Acidimicrobiia bacterium]